MCGRLAICILHFSLLASFGGIGLCAGEKDEKVIVLVGARLIDGTGRPPLENGVLIIRGDKLSAMGTADSVKYPDNAADFVVLTANPLENIPNTEKIAAVWHRGKQVSGPIASFSQ